MNLVFDAPLRSALEAHAPGLADRTEAQLRSLVRPCIEVNAEQVSELPLRRGFVGRLFGGKVAPPVLPPLASKFGGVPYAEAVEDWVQHTFLGQIDLAEATALLEPADRLRGLLRFDLAHSAALLRVRWFPEPHLDKAVAAPRVTSVGAYEARLRFKRGQSIPRGKALDALFPKDEEIWHRVNEWEPAGFVGDERDEYHRLLGWPSTGSEEPYAFTPVPGAPTDMEDYAQLLRLTFDNTAEFSFGTNWLYIVVPQADLKTGDLSRAVAYAANV